MQLMQQDDEKTQSGEDSEDKVDNLDKIRPDEVALGGEVVTQQKMGTICI